MRWVTLLLLSACGRMGFESTNLSGDDAPVVDASTADRPPISSNIVFVTSVKREPYMFGSLAGADAFCAEKAAAAGLPGTYVAWLSSPTVDAVTRLGSARGWQRTDGLAVVDTVADLLAGKLFHPIILDENGNAVGSGAVVTATNPAGMLSSNLGGGNAVTCNDWTLDTGDYTGGDATGTTDEWTRGWVNDCRVAARLYCFGIDLAASVTPAPATGRRAFLSAPHILGGGLAAADQACNTEAQANGLSGSFRALVADAGVTAASRFDPSGPTWVRADGVPLAPTASEVLGGAWTTTLSVGADGAYRSEYVWTGASAPGVAGTTASTCDRWTTSTANMNGVRGSSAKMEDIFAATGQAACNAQIALYCLEQ